MNIGRNNSGGVLLKVALIQRELRYIDVVRAASKRLPEDEQLSEVTLSRIVTGRKTPSPEQAAAICAVLRVSVEQVFPNIVKDGGEQ
jgi:transcriptional regulator with XRE-family HTH domain